MTLNVMFKNKPIAVDDNYQTKINTSFSTDGTVGKLKLTANDYTPNGQTYNYTTTPETKATANGGTVQIFADGNFTYTPPNGFTGIDQFNYTVHNPNGSKVGLAKVSVLPIIFVKLVENDEKFINHTDYCNGIPSFDLEDQTSDFTLHFYSNSLGTMPFDVSGLNFKVIIKESTFLNQTNTNNIVYETSVLSNTNVKILDDFMVTEMHIDCSNGQRKTRSKTVTIQNGAYNII